MNNTIDSNNNFALLYQNKNFKKKRKMSHVYRISKVKECFLQFIIEKFFQTIKK
jgi:phosphoribosylaminoimidazole carboxylase (NCAIR synthetase)